MKLNNQSIKLFGFLLIFATISAFSQKPESNLLKSYNFIWDTPSKNASGSMPVEGGNIQLNAWSEKDEILFYIGSTDSYLESATMLAKLGRVRLSFSLNPFKTVFQQKLDLEKSEILFTGDNGFKLTLWVDVFHPIIDVEMESGNKTVVTATYETWKLEGELNNQVTFHHLNPVKNEELATFVALQRVEDFQEQIPDPLRT